LVRRLGYALQDRKILDRMVGSPTPQEGTGTSITQHLGDNNELVLANIRGTIVNFLSWPTFAPLSLPNVSLGYGTQAVPVSRRGSEFLMKEYAASLASSDVAHCQPFFTAD
jgi:hypothetical protein